MPKLGTDYKIIELPCGQCMECRLRHRQAWATRLMLEKKNWQHAYFITLTYDDEHLPKHPVLDKETGEIFDQSNLVKKDLQDFWKRWRGDKKSKWSPGKCKYFACGEYGDTTRRSHYHRILFQEQAIPDLKFLKLTRDHLPLWTSETLDDKWGNGICFIGEVTMESAGYVARYITKKQTGEYAKIYETMEIEPEFVTMSNGIGMDYFKEHWQEIYRNDQIILPNMHGEAKKVRPPRAFDEELWIIQPELLEEHKERRLRAAQRTRNHKQAQTSRKDWAEIEQRTRAKKQEMLRREDN